MFAQLNHGRADTLESFIESIVGVLAEFLAELLFGLLELPFS
jgi:hypothetical protein